MNFGERPWFDPKFCNSRAAPFSSAILNCSRPSPASLLSSLKPVFELNSIRPVINMSVPTQDEKTQVLTTFIWESLEWKNDFTLWNPEECGVEWMAVARNLLWVPDIVINEFMEKNTAPEVPYTYLHYDGMVYDAKPVRVVSSCSLNIYLFPFDVQNCTFTFNSYIHSNFFLSLCLTMMVTSLLETIFITNLLQGSAHYNPPPRWIRMFVLHILGRLVLLPPKPEHQEDLVIKNPDVQEMVDGSPLSKENETTERRGTLKEDETLQVLKNLGRDLQAIHRHLKRSPSSEEWIQIGLIIDRLLFIFYVLFMLVSFISIMIIWVTSYYSMPAVNLSNPTITNISFTLYAVLGVNEKAQILTTFLWLRLGTGFPSGMAREKGGGRSVPLWPGGCCSCALLTTFFCAGCMAALGVDDDVSQACPYVYVNHTGHIRWDRMLRLVSACNLEIFRFPFDVQNCTFTFGSYMHTIRDVRVSPALTFSEMSENSKQYLQASGEWELVDILGETSILQFGVDEWDIITFWVVIRRRPVLYVVNLLIPSSFLMLIDILSFYLPPHSVDRASFKMTLILGYTVFLLIMNDLLPSTANGTPIIGIYFSVCLALMVISLLETVIITNVLHHSSMKYQEVPNWVRIIVLKHIANLICYRWPENVRPTHKTQEDKPESSNSNTGPWAIQPVNQAADRHPTHNGVSLPELQLICQYLRDLRAHLLSVQKENELLDQWCHVGYVLDFLLFRIYLLLISCYAMVIITMWCIWISQS
ncbi:hypothetical protein CRENBAI_007580 [Crenichthys baileyi]|uniref:5-hydroxytryptamine receptor 3A n=1 Tax=Crenichthys baileyi TaxID=28760 RepID=A0AAV9SQV9_9TELE